VRACRLTRPLAPHSSLAPRSRSSRYCTHAKTRSCATPSEGVATSAIEGEHFDPNALRSSLARRLGLPTAGLPAPPRAVEGLVDVLLDATQKLDKPLTQKMLASWQAALFPTGRSGLAKIRVGSLRGASPMRIVSGPVGRQKLHYEAPPRRGLERSVRGRDAGR